MIDIDSLHEEIARLKKTMERAASFAWAVAQYLPHDVMIDGERRSCQDMAEEFNTAARSDKF